MWMDPAVLDGMVALRRLEVSLRYGNSYIFEAAELRLLSNIGKMQHLTHLALDFLVTRADTILQPELYSALTSPEFMHTLELNCCHLCPGAWRQLFNAAKPLRHLTRLRLRKIDRNLTAADLKGIAKACTGLKELDLVGSTQPKISLLPLRQLTGLISL
jgi:hypothetical protein